MRQRSRAVVVVPAAVLAASLWMVGLLAADEMVKGPYIQNVQPDRVTVMWETDGDREGSVEYGRTAALGERAGDTRPRRIHEVTLAGLLPRTTYHYRVRTESAVSETATFATSFHGEGAFSFAVYGDNRSFPERHAEVIKLIGSRRPDFVLHTGDLVHFGPDYDGWEREFFGPARALMRSCCVWPVLGNHELDAEHYFNFFSLPEPERWYAFTWGNARFIGLDSDSDLSADSEQTKWLAGELARRRTTWTFVFLHYPPFSAGLHGSSAFLRDALVPLLEKHRVDLVFTGHNHLYERTYPLANGRRNDAWGVVYVTTAGGGAPLYGFDPEPWTAAAASRLHACFVRMDGPNLRLEARDVTGQLIDDFEMTKDRGRVDGLLAALKSPDPSKAVSELGRLGEVRAVPRLVELLRSGAAPTRCAAAEALSRINVPAGVAALAGVVRDPHPGVRRFALRGLARSLQEAHLPALAAALNDTDQGVVAEAIEGLAWTRAAEAERPLVRFLTRPGVPPALRLKAVEALSQLRGGPPSYDHLEDLTDAEPILIELLDHPDMEIAREAAKGLKEHNSPEARQALCRALAWPYEAGAVLHEEFDEEVLASLKNIADRSCGEALIRFVADTKRSARNRERAADLLDKITGLRLQYDPRRPKIDLQTAIRHWRAALKSNNP